MAHSRVRERALIDTPPRGQGSKSLPSVKQRHFTSAKGAERTASALWLRRAPVQTFERLPCPLGEDDIMCATWNSAHPVTTEGARRPQLPQQLQHPPPAHRRQDSQSPLPMTMVGELPHGTLLLSNPPGLSRAGSPLEANPAHHFGL